MTPGPPVRVGDRDTPPLWRNRSFLLMWSSVAASGFGDRLIQLAAWSMLGVHLVGSDASSIQAGVSFFFFLPYVILGPAAGWLADTLPRKWLMLFCDEARAAVLGLAFVLVPAGAVTAIPSDHHWKVFAIIAGVGALAAFFSPAKAATIPQIVPVRQLQPANAIVLGIAVIASLIGFAIGGPIMEQWSVRAGLGVAIVSYSVSGTFFAFMHLRPHRGEPIGERPSQLQRLIDAVRYVRHHRPIWQLIGLSVLFWAAATVTLAAIAALCKTRYGLPEDAVIAHTATMMAVMGAGMLASSFWVAWVNARRESAWFAMIALLIAGALMVVMALNRSYHVGLVLGFAVGFWGNAAMICVSTLTQSIAPDYIRGRVFGVRDLFNTLSAVIVNGLIWRLPRADQYMVGVLIFVAGVLVLVAGWGLWREITSGPESSRTLNGLWRLCRAYTLVWHRLRWVNRHNVPTQGAVILAANHTTGLDPLLIQAAVPRTVRWIMLRSYQTPWLGPLWRRLQPIAVEQDGKDTTQLREIIRRLHEGQAVGIFPEGGAQRGNRQLKPFQPGVGLLAKRSQAMVIPIWIHGTPQAQHMLWHFLRPSRSVIVFGQPIALEKSMTHEQVADTLRQRMLQLSAFA